MNYDQPKKVNIENLNEGIAGEIKKFKIGLEIFNYADGMMACTITSKLGDSTPENTSEDARKDFLDVATKLKKMISGKFREGSIKIVDGSDLSSYGQSANSAGPALRFYINGQTGESGKKELQDMGKKITEYFATLESNK